MTIQTKIFANPTSVADAFATDFSAWVAAQQSDTITVALSGGSTPKLLFQAWAEHYRNSIPWSRVHFFWGDERCVPPTSSDSNYGVAHELFLSRVQIPSENIHRVLGEASPDAECLRYADEIRQHVRLGAGGMPQFDLVILGMGDDGHTASIFPHESHFLKSPRICEVATHPESGQKRITLTGPVINAARRVTFLITGASKARVLSQVMHRTGDFANFPAAHITADQVDFYLDEAAAPDPPLGSNP